MRFITGPDATFDDLQRSYEVRVPDVSREIAATERMPAANLNHYLCVGEGAIRLIKLALLTSGKRPAEIKKILDLPCGHGRVLRTIRSAFPDAELTAADLLTDGVDFCAATFSAIPVYSRVHPTTDLFPSAGEYDLIFVGSLLTHVDAPRWPEFLTVFHDLLAPGGILVATTHGPFVAYRMQAGETYGYTDQQAPASALPDERTIADRAPNRAIGHILAQYRKTGFGYLDAVPGYGISISEPSWVLKQLEAIPGFRILNFIERGWDNHQDAFAAIKRPFTTPDAAVGHPLL